MMKPEYVASCARLALPMAFGLLAFLSVCLPSCGGAGGGASVAGPAALDSVPTQARVLGEELSAALTFEEDSLLKARYAPDGFLLRAFGQDVPASGAVAPSPREAFGLVYDNWQTSSFAFLSADLDESGRYVDLTFRLMPPSQVPRYFSFKVEMRDSVPFVSDLYEVAFDLPSSQAFSENLAVASLSPEERQVYVSFGKALDSGSADEAYGLYNSLPEALRETHSVAAALGRVALSADTLNKGLRMKIAENAARFVENPTSRALLMGYAHLSSENYAKAFENFDQARAGLPDDPMLDYQLGVVCVGAKDWDGARQCASKLLDKAKDPDLQEYGHRLSINIAYAKGDHAATLKAMQKYEGFAGAPIFILFAPEEYPAFFASKEWKEYQEAL